MQKLQELVYNNIKLILKGKMKDLKKGSKNMQCLGT